MVSDPRCPHCSEKVSATATWCMHCGRDFDGPVDADGGRLRTDTNRRGEPDLEAALNEGDLGAIVDAAERGEAGGKAVGVALAVVALLTLPMVAPTSGATLVYLVLVGLVGYVAATQDSVAGAVETGTKALAAAPFVLWAFVALQRGFTGVTVSSLFGPVVYAGLALYAARAYRRRAND